MALRRPPTTFSDSIDASDLAANSVTASELADNAVDAAAIAASAVTSTKIAANAISVKPHIQYGVLQPAVAGKDLSGTALGGSYVYGAAHTDGHKYYYTDIKGSKPIKDPRIGAHFGSQRHMIGSRQLLEQETAQSGEDIYSFDGREFFRGQCPAATTNENSSGGVSVNFTEISNFIEITGYFNAVNLIIKTANGTRTWLVHVDGVQAHSALSVGATVDSPLDSRFVRATSLSNIDITSSSSLSSDTTLGIHTLKMKLANAASQYIYGIELIAHGLFTDATCDTNHTSGLGSPASTSKITMDSTSKVVAGMSVTGTGIAAGTTVSSVDSATVLTLSAATTATNADQTFTFGVADLSIPAQNVVSYGKKFSVSAAAQHYDPFNGLSGAKTLAELGTYIDTATSLGMENWKGGTSNYYKPFNGGRVVKWVDSSGTIKTSVTMMPPNAQNVGTTASNAFSDGEVQAGTNDHTITFNTSAIDHSQAEVAKTFHWREFGNGNANSGNSGNYKDASMLTTSEQDIAYVMDDGLTSLSANAKEGGSTRRHLYRVDANSFSYLTFIGTGITKTIVNSGVASIFTIAQNLPYGTHIFKQDMDASTSAADWYIDGVKVADITGGSPNYEGEMFFEEMSIHQPKKPPIPEDAVIISDYMLMADYVKSSTVLTDTSKGIRLVSTSRDCFHDVTSGTINTLVLNATRLPFGLDGINASVNGAGRCKLPAFGTQMEVQSHSNRGDIFVDGVDMDQTPSGSGETGFMTQNVASTLGVHNFESRASSSNHNVSAIGIVTPIHTSSHYQTFETPFLKELVGGDRNMEQNNLIVTPDGKSWDEVTRDTSYLSNMRFQAASGASDMNSTQVYFPDDVRGRQGTRDLGNKDFAIAYDRLICLVDGVYCVGIRGYSNALVSSEIKINGTLALQHNLGAGSGGQNFNPEVTVHLKRGDYIQWNSPYNGGHYGDWWVWKV